MKLILSVTYTKYTFFGGCFILDDTIFSLYSVMTNMKHLSWFLSIENKRSLNVIPGKQRIKSRFRDKERELRIGNWDHLINLYLSGLMKFPESRFRLGSSYSVLGKIPWGLLIITFKPLTLSVPDLTTIFHESYLKKHL